VKLALDTNAYRALGEGDKALAAEVRRAEAIGVPIIVLGELRYGFMNGSKLHENTSTLERFLATPRVAILHVTDETTWLFGEVATLLRRSGRPIQQDDMWIAALCKQHGHTLATRDRGFEHVVGLDVFDYAAISPAQP
jgi:tRNA(fMet)-specific endonuclease VapC